MDSVIKHLFGYGVMSARNLIEYFLYLQIDHAPKCLPGHEEMIGDTGWTVEDINHELDKLYIEVCKLYAGRKVK